MGVQVNYISEVKMGHRTTKTNHKAKVHKTVSCRIDFFYYVFRNVLLVSVPLLILSALILGLSTSHSFAVGSGSSGTDNIQLVLSTSCTVNAVVTSEHTVSLNGGQLDNNVGNTKLSAYCNDNNGYSIYAVGSSGDIDGNTDLIYNNGLSDSYNIRTGVYNDTIQTNPSSWAMKLTAGTGTGIDPVTGESVPTTPPTIINGYDNYSAIPNVYTQVAKRTSGTSMTTDTSVSGSYLDTTYQIYANSAQPAGTYNGKVKYIILHPGTDAPNTINDIDAAFAMAEKQKYPQESGAYYAMQDMTTDICNSVSRNGENTSTQLVDLRDNKLYWVTKLKDGHCWMTQNLDFDIKANTTLNSQTTDLNVAYDSTTGNYQEYNDGYIVNNGIIYWTPASTATTIDFEDTTVTGWVNNNTEPYSANKTDSTETGHTSLGNYYNWTAAIASSDSSSLITSTYNDISNNPRNSICPKGWRLPTISNQSEIAAGSTNEFARLGDLYGVSNILLGPIYFTKNGNTYNESLANTQNGYYWSSTYLSQRTKSCADIINDTLQNASHDASNGFPIRCVAK